MPITYGVDYYPEHWPEERWETDARLMREAGFEVARMAEFAWCRMEPRTGELHWDWLDRAIECLGEYGIKTILGTPTATPPLWLIRKYPEARGAALSGMPWYEGSRRHYCPTSPSYRRESRRITQAMAERYAGNPNVIGWQTDNEFGCHVFACGCDSCERAFREWVRERYGTVERVNAAWGMVVWSNELGDWDDLPLPRPMPALPNPSHALAYRRFISDAWVGFQREQVEILRRLCPGQFITHNMMGLFDALDYYRLAEDLDLVSWDNYPGFYREGDEPRMALVGLAADAMRGVKGNRPFWVMEEQAGPTTWEHIGPTPRPGQLRLWAYQQIAHGADGIIYFRWRTNRVGPEQYWHGLLDHSGEVNRRYREAAAMGAEIGRLEEIAGSGVPAEVAIVRDYETIWAFEIQRQTPSFSYDGQVASFHRALTTCHVPVHIVPPSADLDGYKLVVLPSQYLIHEGQVERLESYVRGGGHLIVTPRSGVKDEENVVTDLPLPGKLAGLCGVIVEEYDPLYPDLEQTIRWDEAEYRVRGWADILQEEGATALARYGTDYYVGRAALTTHDFGDGRVVYLGTLGDDDLYLRLVQEAIAAAKVTPLLPEPAPLEVMQRSGPNGSYLFLLNHGTVPVSVPQAVTGVGMLQGEPAEGGATIAPRDLVILRVQDDSG